MQRITILLIVPLLFLFAKCKKDITPKTDCIVPAIVPFTPYSYPVWHPNSQFFGFNYTPLSGIGSNGIAPCIWYSYFAKSDSTGFYIMNKDGTGLKRITNYNLYAPAWSPDGNWLAFTLGSQIYKMRFTGAGFDTANIVQLTPNGANFFPNWTSNSDSVYYDSNVGTPVGTSYYAVWKMSASGSNKIQVSPTGTYGRQPFNASNNLVYYQYYSGQQPEIFSMSKDGSNQSQVTFNGQYGNRGTPKFFQGNLYYIDNGTLRVIKSTNQDVKLIFPCVTYDISTNGDIVYSKMDYSITTYNKQIGTLWIMNSDGTNNRQLTFNNF
jgi:Tol biopolymer transport system component